MENIVSLNKFNEINSAELRIIDGGRNKAAYYAGYYTGKAAQWALLGATFWLAL